MTRFLCFWAVALALILCAEAKAGGPPPVTMAVDKVIFEPNEAAPTAVQIWGTFTFLQENKSTYGPPQRGYFYYAIAPGKEDRCRQEWTKLKKLADAGQLVCYGFCNEPRVSGHLRKAADKPHTPDLFPVASPEWAGFRSAYSSKFKELVAASRRSASEKPGGRNP